jgi:PAS domain S-box-containing protein
MKDFLIASDLVYYAAIDMQSNYMEVNQAFCDAFGLDSPESWRGLPYLPTVHPDDIKICIEAARECFEKGGTKVSFQIRKPKKTGKYWYTLWEMEALRNAEGNFVGMHGIGVDETAANAYQYMLDHQMKILDNVGDLVSLSDPDNRPIYINPALKKMLGYSPEEVLENPKLLIDRIQPESLDNFTRLNSRDEQGNWPEGIFEIKWQHKDGHTITIEHHVANILNENNELIGRVSMGKDITDLRRYQEDSLRFRELFESLMEHSPLMGMVVGEHGEILASNEAARRIFGQPIQGKIISDILPADTDQALNIQIKDVFATKKSYHREGVYKLNSGEFYLEVVLFPVRWNYGLFDGVMVLIRDRSLFYQIRKQSELLSLVARHTTNYVIITDAKGLTVWVNDTFCKKTRFLPSEMIGKKPGHLLQGPETDPQTRKRISQAIAEGKAYHEEILNYTRNGEKYWIKIDCSPVYDEYGQLINFVAIQTDTTHERSQLESLKKSERQNRVLINALERSSMVTLLETNLTINYSNQEFATVFGKQAEQMSGMKFDPFATMDFNPITLVNNGFPWRGEIQYLLPNGDKIWLDLMISPMSENDKKVSQYLVVAQDITARKQVLELIELRNEYIKTELEARVVQRTYELEVEKAKLAETHNRLISSIFYAKRIQRAIFPPEHEIREHFSDFFVFDLPKDVVSGDFYWFGHVKGKSIIALVDCTGHGIPGALLTVLAYSALNEIILYHQITDPVQIMEALDERIQSSLKQKSSDVQDGMDLAVCVVDKAAGIMDFAGAKSDLVYIEDGNLNVAKGSRMLVGGIFKPRDKTFEPTRITLKPGQTFYLSSDGYKDQIGGPDKRKFGSQQLFSLFLEIHDKPFILQRDILDQKLVGWLLNFPMRFDDVMVLGFRL